MNAHGALSIIANIQKEKADVVRNLLSQIDSYPNDNRLIVFSRIKTIHFARFVLCPECQDAKGKKIPSQLVFTTNYDVPLKQHIAELVKEAGPGLWEIFSLCEGFPSGKYDENILLDFIQRNNKKAATFYVGVGSRSVSQIRQEHQLRKLIESYLDINRRILLSLDAVAIRKMIIDFVFHHPDLTWAVKPAAKAGFMERSSKVFRLIVVILIALLLSPVIIPFVIVWLLLILFCEVREKQITCSYDKIHLESLLIRERGIVQNQFSACGNLKPGWLRLQTMKSLLGITDFLAPYIFSKGKLSGIPTVHFARWLITNDGRQMLFLSNYDGNSESYLRDFIHIAAKQLSLLFSHTIGYPKTRFMVFGGAKDAKCFMEWARKNQLITNVWYSANPDVSLKNMLHNSKIREGLYGDMDEVQSQKWLQLL